MSNPAQEQPGADPINDFPPLNPNEGYGRSSTMASSSQRGHSSGPIRRLFLNGFSTGFLGATVLCALAYFLIIKPHSPKPVEQTLADINPAVSSQPNSQPKIVNFPSSPTTSTPSQNPNSLISSTHRSDAAPSDHANAAVSRPFISGITPHRRFRLNLEERHPNGTVLRVHGVAFNSDAIALQMAVTNSHHDKIKLNELWATTESTMILEDNLGNAYRVAPPLENQEIEVEPGTTARGEFIFPGKVGPSTNSLTLTTNSIAGLPHNSITHKPKIRIKIPLDQLVVDQ
ncbi:MAG: hypothetical protein QNJ46_18365 [Leptolyngbyaceae cyanobacterium MO_188.B28]|nr:hypothetical protein [Leptolyngbyaceae cyanobacterium MO_188.B28]